MSDTVKIAVVPDAAAAVDIMKALGWTNAYVNQHGALFYGPDQGVAAGRDKAKRVIWQPRYYDWQPREGCTHRIASIPMRTLAEAAREIARWAVTRGVAPDMDAARALVASWDSPGADR